MAESGLATPQDTEVQATEFESSGVGTSSIDLVLNIDGFEGPIDMLLHLARKQKVDLAQISIHQIVDQYLRFIETAKRLRVELAADYLVMASWLAYLKSKLLVPKVELDDEDNGDLAEHLHFRLQQLESMREAAKALVSRPRLGVSVFARPEPEGVEITKQKQFDASLYDLLTAYAEQSQRKRVTTYKVAKREVWSINDARDRLDMKVSMINDWDSLDSLLSEFLTEPEMTETVTASGFGAILEYAKEGRLDIRQSAHFEPIYVRSRG